jgi:hypothetical protein
MERKKIKNIIIYTFSMSHQGFYPVRQHQILFSKNLHIIGLESKILFLMGINQKSIILQRGKHILTLKKIKDNCKDKLLLLYNINLQYGIYYILYMSMLFSLQNDI